MNKITIKNISTATVQLSLPDIRFTRELLPGRAIPVTQEVYDELTYDAGFMNLLNAHYLMVTGIDAEDQVQVDGAKVYTKDDISKMLDTQDVTGFAKFIPTATVAEKEAVVTLAVDKGITTPAFVTLIKKYCDVDIINAINVKHQSEEK